RDADLTRMRILVKLCIGMIDAGKAYNTANRQFVNGIQELAQQSAKDDVIESSLNKFAENLQEMINYHTFIMARFQRPSSAHLRNGIAVRRDLRKFKEAKKQFDKVSEEKEAALSKNAQAPRNKQHEVEEATSILIATRKCFRHIVLDYVLQINVLHELQPLMKQLTGQLDQLVIDSAKERKDMEMKHSTIQHKDFSNDDTKLEYNVDAENGIVMEGYLFKRASNAFKTWNRRWFSIQNNQLVYQKKFKDNPTVVVEDLRLCTVKHCEDIERRFCFEVVSPTKSCMMQADSEKLRQAWIKAVQNSIATAFRDKAEDAEKMDGKSSTSTCSLDSAGEVKERSLKGESALQRVMGIGGNSICCDCGQPEPCWASINLGITLCIQCSGIHRSLGVHFSKVRSLTLDTWEPELLKLMCELGNGVINQIYEARREELGARKPQPGDPRHEVEAYIKAKYVERRFVQRRSEDETRQKVLSLRQQDKRLSGCSEARSGLSASTASASSGERTVTSASAAALPSAVMCWDQLDGCLNWFDSQPTPGLQLFWASFCRSLPDMAEALAHGAAVNWTNANEQNRTPLMMAVHGGSLVACEFLLQNSASVNQQDNLGRGPLHHATILGHTGQVCLFLKRGANQNAADVENQTPLSIAVEAANADIVTLLRLAKMNEEMRESEGLYSQSGDETYQDIFQDFSQMASNDPDKLNRY
uniref:Arf-GAP with coiled-coil, ANK repeat and PH domain-containing protein n=1 Tax=Sinocyclocheilus anshuiensis TaxID=1608454 RepID=A0A671SU84_9TELE